MSILDYNRLIKEIQNQTVNYLKACNKNYLVTVDDNSLANSVMKEILPSKLTINLHSLDDKISNELYCEKYNCIIFSPLTKELIYLKQYRKHYQGDFAPFADLFFSELLELAIQFKIDTSLVILNQEEWLVREDEKNQIISSSNNPVNNPAWLGYTKEQRELVSLGWALLKKRNHKKLLSNSILVRSISGLVR